MRGDENRPALIGKCKEQLLELDPLAGVGAVERLVEDQQLGFVHQRRRKTNALPHAARVGAYRAIGRVAEPHALDGSRCRRRRVVDLAKRGGELDERSSAHEVIAPLVLDHDPHAAVKVAVGTRVAAEDAYLAL